MGPRINVLSYTPLFGVLSAACSNSELSTITTMATGHMLAVSRLLELRAQRAWTQQEARKAQMGLGVISSMLLGATMSTQLQKASVSGRHPVLLIAPLLALLAYILDHLAKPRSLAKKIRRRLSSSSHEKSSLTKDNLSSREASEDEQNPGDDGDDDISSISEDESNKHDTKDSGENARLLTAKSAGPPSLDCG